MSRFQDFDEFLNEKQKEEKATHNAHIQALVKARAHFDPLIREIFALFKEYYETILTPRRKLILVMKRKEDVPRDMDEEKPSYIYRINLVARQIVPMAFDLSYVVGEHHLTPKKLTQHDWHPHVALQFELALEYTDETSYSDKVKIRVTMKAWGDIQIEEKPLSSHITLSHMDAYSLPYMELKLENKTLSNQDFVKEIESALIFITPNVLNHSQEVWGKEL